MTRQPVPAPGITTPILLLSWGIGVLMGGLGVVAVYDNDTRPVAAVPAAVAPQLAETLEVNVVLQLPTGTATSVPTVRPTIAATVAMELNDCGTAAPGSTCKMVPAPTATDAPLPDCPAAPGEWCVWPGSPSS